MTALIAVIREKGMVPKVSSVALRKTLDKPLITPQRCLMYPISVKYEHEKEGLLENKCEGQSMRRFLFQGPSKYR